MPRGWVSLTTPPVQDHRGELPVFQGRIGLEAEVLLALYLGLHRYSSLPFYDRGKTGTEAAPQVPDIPTGRAMEVSMKGGF